MLLPDPNILVEPPICEDDEAPPAWAEQAESAGIVARDYQVEAKAACEAAWAEGLRSVLVVKGTGLGKTLTFSAVAQTFVANGGKVLILAHTDELLVQAAEKLTTVSGIDAAREKASERAHPTDPVVISSIQTLSRPARLESWPKDHFALVIIDEAHRSASKSYVNILAHFDKAKVMGVTATPDRSDEKSLGQIFEKCVFDYGILQGVRDGWLVRPVAKTVPLKVDMRGIKIKGQDLDAAEISRRLEPFLDEVAGKLIEHAGTRRTLIFLPSVNTAMSLATKLAARGATADFVSGDKERCVDRHGTIERYASGEIQFLCNAMLLTEGFDDPATSCVCVLRPTKSRALFTQCCGRGTRTLPGVVDGLHTPEERRAAIAASAKPDLLILDFLWLTDRLDLCRPAHVIASKPEVAAFMKEGNGDLLMIEEKAERDLLMSVATEAAKHKRKLGRTFDLVKAAVTVGDDELKNYKPVTALDRMPPSKEQIKILENNGVDVSQINCTGLASAWIARIDRRKQAGLCSFRQMAFLTQLGVKDVAMLSSGAAGRLMGVHQRQKTEANVLHKGDMLWQKDSTTTHLVLAASDTFAICSMPFSKDGVKFCIIDWKNKMRAETIESGTLLPFDFSREEDCKMAVRGLTSGALKMPGDSMPLNLHRVQKGAR